MRITRVFAAAFLLLTLAAGAGFAQQKPAWEWYEVDDAKYVKVNLYVFWSERCPHCPQALEFADWLQGKYPWVVVHKREISRSAENRDLYQRMTASLNRVGGQTPAFFYCKQMVMGYTSYEQSGKAIEQNLIRWHEALEKHFKKETPTAALAAALILLQDSGSPPPDDIFPDLPVELPPEAEKVTVPGWGEVEAANVSLPAVTAVLAACDSFNPCAFFVLLLLLSMLVHGRSRVRMALVGGIFVAASGIMYFLFMAAWLNLFFVIGHLRMITVAAGLAALVVGLLNTKDFFWFQRGPTLSIPESAKPGLFQRMARLINVTRLPSLIVGAAGLAVLANFYELLCTAGFPMVYTRILTLRELPTGVYYGYLTLYNLIYVAPMALIVAGFVLTLGSRKLTEFQGRVLKLMSGTMMLGLGGALLLWQDVLHSPVGALSILLGALAVTSVAAALERRRIARPAEAADPKRNEHDTSEVA